MSSPSSSYGAHSPESCDASTPSASPSSSTASVNAAPTPAKKRPRVSPDDPARLARLAARQARNRQSAQNSRDRKKAEQSAIEEEVITLRQRNAELEAKVAETEKGISALMDLVKVLMKSSVPPPSPSTQEQVAPTTVALSAPAVPAYSPDSLLTASQSSLATFTTDSSLASHLSSSLLPSTDPLAAPMVPASSTSTLSPFSAPSASLLSTTSSHHSSSTANVCHPAAMVNHSLQRTLAGVTPTSVDEETRSGGESTRMSRGAWLMEQYGTITMAAASESSRIRRSEEWESGSKARSRLMMGNSRGSKTRSSRSSRRSSRSKVSRRPAKTSANSIIASPVSYSKPSSEKQQRSRTVRVRVILRPLSSNRRTKASTAALKKQLAW